MRFLVVADVHSNLEALSAVIEDAGPVDAVWSLGDVVGYGPDPGACIEVLRSFPLTAIAGNHDVAAAAVVGTQYFNPVARQAIEWTRGQLATEARDWLAGLPMTHTEDDFTLVHGSLRDPVWEYLVSSQEARPQFQAQLTPYCLVGHSHLPLCFAEGEAPRALGEEAVALSAVRLIVNPGSVGQPRDGDLRAAYAVVDTVSRTLDCRRVAYDLARTQAKIMEAGLPVYLAARLADGR